MKTTNINRMIEDFNALVLEEKEFTLEIITKILIEAHRESISKRARAAMANYKKKKIKQGTLKDLYNDLEND
jgi:hypothetical protein